MYGGKICKKLDANIQTLKEKKRVCDREVYTRDSKVSQFTTPPSAFLLPSIYQFFIN